ncbi:pyrroline-5-carboxylate reductase 3 [Platysternon megacephalum]|uniref:Pyrroline-5-carboxylate reductase 3 n=1 Tax=Platysternon megacephalum TaxID=55544 RepID=A0A4D9E3T9_9SAUR|nr:pyrroline-5-carboxylate reductase 3 [Platysternon megacephalum]
MKVYAVTTIAVLSVQLFFLVQAGDGKGLVDREKQVGAERVRKAPQPSDGGEKAPEGSSVRCQPAARVQKAAGEAGVGARSHSKLLSKPQRESSKQKATSKQQSPQLQPPKRKSPGSSNHLEGHGNFNTDTVDSTKAYKAPEVLDPAHH